MRRILAAALALCIATPAFAQSALLPANQVWAGPPSGGQGFARARALVGLDIPAPGASSLGGVQSLTCSSSNWFRTLSTAGVFGCSQPAIADISGFGTGVATALGIAVGSAGAPVLFNGAGGTPSSLVATNATGTAAGLTAGHVTTNANSTGDVTSVGNATTYANVVPANKGGAGAVTGALKANGSGTVTQAACADISNATAACSAAAGQLPGEPSTGSASAGNVGEYVTSTGAGVALTAGTAANMTSMSLTAGDWDVSTQIQFTGNASTTVAYAEASVNTVSATPVNPNTAYMSNVTYFGSVNGSGFGVVSALARFSLSTTTTVFAVAKANFGVSTMSAAGVLRARRVR